MRIKMVAYHLLVGAGVALLAVGLSGLQSSQPTDSDEKKVKIGLGIVTAAWALLVLQTAQTALLHRHDRRDDPISRSATHVSLFIPEIYKLSIRETTNNRISSSLVWLSAWSLRAFV